MWKNIPLTKTMEGAVIRLKCKCPEGWEKIWWKINMLYGMKYGKEKGCAEGAHIFWIIYYSIRHKKNAPPSLTLKKSDPPLTTPKKFWSCGKQMAPMPGKKWQLSYISKSPWFAMDFLGCWFQSVRYTRKELECVFISTMTITYPSNLFSKTSSSSSSSIETKWGAYCFLQFWLFCLFQVVRHWAPGSCTIFLLSNKL